MPKKIFIFPYNSLILYDMVSRYGHQPLSIMGEVAKRTSGKVMSPPYNVTLNDSQHGLDSCSEEVPSGVRGRLSYLKPLIDEADAAIFISDPDYAFGSSGCSRTNKFVWHLVVRKDIPILTVPYPRNQNNAREFVDRIVEFLKKLDKG